MAKEADFGLADSLSPPQYKIPSVVYQHPTTKAYKSSPEDQYVAVSPIVKGRIVDVDAYCFLLKVVLQSILKTNPVVTINLIPLLIIGPLTAWSRNSVECVTKYVLEQLEFTALNFLDMSIASNFGIGASVNLLVVNVGYESTQIVPVIGHQVVKFASKSLDIGSSSINRNLARLLPQLTESQVEDLKTLGIYEVIADHENSFYSLTDLDAIDNGDDIKADGDEEFDVAKLVIEGDVTKNIEMAKNSAGEADGEESNKPNHELEVNRFIDSTTGQQVTVGKERFQGTNELVEAIVEAIYNRLLLIPEVHKRQECYNNLIFVGSTFKIPGLKKMILIRLHDFLVRSPQELSKFKEQSSGGVSSAILAYQQAEETIDPTEMNGALHQVPISFKASKYPDYFPEWKNPKAEGGSWEDVYFLGAQIYSKQVFGSNSNHSKEMFMDSDVYEEHGPQGIWNVII
ncbi:Actin-like protein arp9 (SWI/SNF complex component arp9) [Scheffersomyces spartinae]|uniref:Actin-like protein arp9 (SWI/SNF complex component arp9) n=1 Tax=Scheffersomyces spartinae TaxID=45513 RepID=A0A9P7VED6_9ASCO|nr:Actin-like protein arp9 (SWI/SNF complex component arp9) [Scheffersomyces spartinae]KAG7196295.1 Actin-like protein arp9 (SWI/SNF complex component arp9) [Scheffersomyces spartinae]